MNKRRNIVVFRSAKDASFAERTTTIAIAVALFAGCPKPTIETKSAPVYQETLTVVPEPVEAAAIPITFDQLNLNAELDIPFRPEMLTDEVKKLEGERVALSGVMLDTGTFKQQDNFILLRNKEVRHGRAPLFDHLIDVKMRPGKTAKFTKETLRVEGTLRIEPFNGDDGNTWSLYILEDATIPERQTATTYQGFSR